MSDLEKIREWIKTFQKHDIIADFMIDFADQIPGSGSIAPSGLVEISRLEDIVGNVTVRNQYNFGLYYVFQKPPSDNVEAFNNAEWLMDFQRWVQEQSACHMAPTFGDEPAGERIQAQNGVLYAADEEGTAMYMVQLSVQFTKYYFEI